MGFLSQSGQLGIRTQAVQGTYSDPGATSPNQGVFMRYKSGGMNANRDLLIPDPEIGASRDIPDALLGPVAWSGSFDAYCRMEALATLLYGALGAKSADSGSALLGYTHTLTPSASTVPWISIEEKIGNGYEAFQYKDAKINTLHMEADASGYLMTTFALVAMSQTSGITPTAAPRIDTSPLLVGSKITVTYNSVALPAKSFSMDINNNLEVDDFRLGSLFLPGLTEKRRETTAGVKIRPADSSLWKQAVYGSSAATTPTTGATTKQQVVVTITSWEDIPGANAGVKYVTTITFPNCIIAPFNVTPSGDDVLEGDLEIRPVLGTGGSLGTATVVNSYATVA